MKLIFIFQFITIFSNLSNKQDGTFIANCVYDYISNAKAKVFDPNTEHLFRSINDFNNDGLKDVLISGYQSGEWGNAGGNWKIYIQKKDGSFEKMKEELFLHHLATYFDKNESKMLIYNRLGCCEGVLIKYHFNNNIVQFIESKRIKNTSSIEHSQQIDTIISKNPKFKKLTFEQAKLKGTNRLIWK